MKIKKITTDFMESNCYILFNELKEGILIDPGGSSSLIKQRVITLGVQLKGIVNTHGHIDHIVSNGDFYHPKRKKELLPVWIHQEDISYLKNSDKNLSSMLDVSYEVENPIRELKEGKVIKIGNLLLKVIHTPGHTPGSICLKSNKVLFTGDTLFREGIGRTDFPGSSFDELQHSIKKKLFVLKDDIKIYPGHGPISTIGYEKKHNPFVSSKL